MAKISSSEELFKICSWENCYRTPLHPFSRVPFTLGVADGSTEIQRHALSVGIDKRPPPLRGSRHVLVFSRMCVFAPLRDIACVGWSINHRSPDTSCPQISRPLLRAMTIPFLTVRVFFYYY